jgi:predicted phage tail protein
MKKLTKIKLHGNLGKIVGQKVWELRVESVSEAIHAIDTMSDRKFCAAVLHNEKQNIKYKILTDGKNLFSKNINTAEEVLESELMIKKDVDTIDIVPVLEGADGDTKDVMLVVGGAMMMGAGFMMGSPLLVQLGLFAILTGMANLLAEPPEFEDFKEIQQTNKRESYLFNGPLNTYNPGGPIPIGYGRVLVGSQTVAFSQTNSPWKIMEANSDGTETWFPEV